MAKKKSGKMTVSKKIDAQKLVEIRAALNDGAWVEVMKNSRDTLLKIVDIVYDN